MRSPVLIESHCICLRSRYTVSAYVLATRCLVLRKCTVLPGSYRRSAFGREHRYPIGLRACYAVSGTDLVYAAMRCPVLTWRRVTSSSVRATRVWYCAMCGTDLAYGATRLAATSPTSPTESLPRADSERVRVRTRYPFPAMILRDVRY
eukprot:3687315-Rhodomonas_salina.1